MTLPPDDTDRRQCVAFVDQIFSEAASGHATEILFRTESERIQTFFLIDGKYEKSLTIPRSYWDLFKHILLEDYFDEGFYQVAHKGVLSTFGWNERAPGMIRIPITRQDVPGRRRGRIDDIFRSFEEPSWDAVKSIFLSILNFALEQGYDQVNMELDGQVVDIGYFKHDIQRTNLTISSDSYDALARLIGENYLAFGFMTREFREKEYLVRLKELNEDVVAPRIVLEIEDLM